MSAFKRLCLLLLTVLFVTVTGNSCFAQTDSKEYNDLLQQYDEFYKKREMDSVIQILYRLEKFDTTNYRIYKVRAGMHYSKNDSVSKLNAIKDMSKAIKLNDTCAYCYFSRGVYRWKWDDKKIMKLVEDDFKKTIQLDSGYFEAYEKLQIIYLDVNNKEAARSRKIAQKYFKSVVDKDTTNAHSWYLLGEAYSLLYVDYEIKSIKDKALAAYSRAIELDSTQIDYYWERAMMYYRYTKNYAGCLHDMKRAIALYPPGKTTGYLSIFWGYVVTCYDNLGQKEEALKAVNTAL